MELRLLGRSGLQVSVIGLGCSNFGRETDNASADAILATALEHGVTLVDTADRYGEFGGSERCLGEILGPRRHDIVLSTKGGVAMTPDAVRGRDASRRHIMRACEDSLRRLKTDYVDLYQLHHPDPLTPIEETLRAFDDLVTQGKVRYIGCSNLKAWAIVDAHWTAKTGNLERFVSAQENYSLLAREVEKEVVPAARSCGISLMAYFPLASGMLTGKYRRDAMPQGARLTEKKDYRDLFVNEEKWRIVEGLRNFCEARGCTMVDLAMSWLVAQPHVASVLPGATRVEQMVQNIKAAQWPLSPSDLAEIDAICAPPGARED